LEEDAKAAIASAGAHFEGEHGYPDRPSRHFVLVDAPDPEVAIDLVRAAVEPFGSFEEFVTKSFEEYGTGPGRRPFSPPGSQPYWDDVATRVNLTAVQQELLLDLCTADEPTWILEEPDLGLDRQGLEAALRDLESKGVVSSSLEQSGQHGIPPSHLDYWWSITDEGWDALGLIKPARYEAW
jgi:hypothetical protein